MNGAPSIRPIRRLVTTVAVISAVSIAAGVQASDEDQQGRPDFATSTLTSAWQFTVAGNLTTFDTAAAWAPKGLAGAAIDLEDSLGLDEQTSTFVIAAQYRFSYLGAFATLSF